VNKNSIPFDPQKPNIASGIRIGTAAVTTRGMDASHMEQIARFIHQALNAVGDENCLAALKRDVAAFCRQFPLHASAEETAALWSLDAVSSTSVG
jgi:glycine hydroxymethyltransferase